MKNRNLLSHMKVKHYCMSMKKNKTCTQKKF